jgi:hypothetical protein
MVKENVRFIMGYYFTVITIGGVFQPRLGIFGHRNSLRFDPDVVYQISGEGDSPCRHPEDNDRGLTDTNMDSQ